MNTPDLLATALRLQQQDQPYALVTVLRVVAPASARPGDKAVVNADGIQQGWIGGGCAQPAVLRTVRLALADGRARVIRIAPADDGSVRELGDVLEFGMTCHSGGTLELFVDPMLPRERLTLIGDSPLAAALAGLAPRVGLPVTVVAHGADPSRFADAEQVLTSDDAAADVASQVAPGSFVVVATQGRRDLQGLRLALTLQARQVFFVASARKAQVLKDALVAAGHDADAVAAIVAPAGQAIGAVTPEEIALSVLAAVVAARRGGGAAAGGVGTLTSAAPVMSSSLTPAATPTAAPLAPLPAAPVATAAQRARPVPLPALPALPAVMGSCCGGPADVAAAGSAEPASLAAAAAAPSAAAVAAMTSALPAAASTPATQSPPSCCGG
jgi:xanthine dehydrogenase accessory factor